MAIVALKLLVYALFVVANGMMMMNVMAAGHTDAPIFIFGDSTVDVGTNLYVKTCTARANHPYHGIDFLHSKPTGRYSNGKNPADQVARLLGNYEVSPPPFLALLAHKPTFKHKLLHGANFASGGAGIYRETGQKTFHRVISLEEQIQQFATARRSITELLGSPNAVDDILQNSIYLMSMGTNDLIEFSAAQRLHPVDPKKFIGDLTQAYAAHLVDLYELGARKFAIIGVTALGCCPAMRVLNGTGGCIEANNDGVKFFYKSMESLLKDLKLKHKGFKYSLGNTYALTMNVIDNPIANGFKDVKSACCGSGTTPCDEGVNLCRNRGDFLFWDKFHPTEKASGIESLTLVYGEGSEYVTPMNFSSLAMLRS